MNLLAPALLGTGLLALPVIMLLHLVHRRPRRQRIPALDLWRDPAPIVQRRPRRLRITLPLLARLLIAALLAVTLGRPLLARELGLPVMTIMLLDTSTSMSATDQAPSRFAAAQATVRQTISGLQGDAQLALIALADPPHVVARGGRIDAARLGNALDSLHPGGHDGSLQAALDLASAIVDPGHRAAIVVLTDPALHTDGKSNAIAPVDWRVFGAPGDNAGFVAFAARSTADGSRLYARVANFGAAPIARTLTVSLDARLAQTESVRLNANSEAEWSWPLPKGTEIATASLNHTDAFVADDDATLVLGNATALHVLLVSSNPSPLERALAAQPQVVVTKTTPDHVTTAGSDLVIFNGVVPATMPPVATWLVAPPSSAWLPVADRRNDLQADLVADQRFGDLDLAPLRFNNVANVKPPAWATVAAAAGSTPLILTGVDHGQPITIWTFDPQAGNLQNRLQFPLLVAATLRTFTAGTGHTFVPGELAPQAVIDPLGHTLPAGAVLAEPGLYRNGERQPVFGLNVLDPSESNLQAVTRPAVNVLPATPRLTGAGLSGLELWRPLLLFICLALLSEVVVGRLYRPGARQRGVTA